MTGAPPGAGGPHQPMTRIAGSCAFAPAGLTGIRTPSFHLSSSKRRLRASAGAALFWSLSKYT